MIEEPATAVRRLLIENQGISAAKVKPHARLLHDLGIDGDDAGEIFEALHAQFGTDFLELDRQWLVFFNYEGVHPRVMLFGILAIVVCGGGAGVLFGALHWPKAAAIIVALVLIVVGSWLLSRFFSRDLRPVTVDGLAEIIRVGHWPPDPSDVR